MDGIRCQPVCPKSEYWDSISGRCSPLCGRGFTFQPRPGRCTPNSHAPQKPGDAYSVPAGNRASWEVNIPGGAERSEEDMAEIPNEDELPSPAEGSNHQPEEAEEGQSATSSLEEDEFYLPTSGHPEPFYPAHFRPEDDSGSREDVEVELVEDTMPKMMYVPTNGIDLRWRLPNQVSHLRHQNEREQEVEWSEKPYNGHINLPNEQQSEAVFVDMLLQQQQTAVPEEILLTRNIGLEDPREERTEEYALEEESQEGTEDVLILSDITTQTRIASQKEEWIDLSEEYDVPLKASEHTDTPTVWISLEESDQLSNPKLVEEENDTVFVDTLSLPLQTSGTDEILLENKTDQEDPSDELKQEYTFEEKASPTDEEDVIIMSDATTLKGMDEQEEEEWIDFSEIPEQTESKYKPVELEIQDINHEKSQQSLEVEVSSAVEQQLGKDEIAVEIYGSSATRLAEEYGILEAEELERKQPDEATILLTQEHLQPKKSHQLPEQILLESASSAVKDSTDTIELQESSQEHREGVNEEYQVNTSPAPVEKTTAIFFAEYQSMDKGERESVEIQATEVPPEVSSAENMYIDYDNIQEESNGVQTEEVNIAQERNHRDRVDALLVKEIPVVAHSTGPHPIQSIDLLTKKKKIANTMEMYLDYTASEEDEFGEENEVEVIEPVPKIPIERPAQLTMEQWSQPFNTNANSNTEEVMVWQKQHPETREENSKRIEISETSFVTRPRNVTPQHWKLRHYEIHQPTIVDMPFFPPPNSAKPVDAEYNSFSLEEKLLEPGYWGEYGREGRLGHQRKTRPHPAGSSPSSWSLAPGRGPNPRVLHILQHPTRHYPPYFIQPNQLSVPNYPTEWRRLRPEEYKPKVVDMTLFAPPKTVNPYRPSSANFEYSEPPGYPHLHGGAVYPTTRARLPGTSSRTRWWVNGPGRRPKPRVIDKLTVREYSRYHGREGSNRPGAMRPGRVSTSRTSWWSRSGGFGHPSLLRQNSLNSIQPNWPRTFSQPRSGQASVEESEEYECEDAVEVTVETSEEIQVPVDVHPHHQDHRHLPHSHKQGRHHHHRSPTHHRESSQRKWERATVEEEVDETIQLTRHQLHHKQTPRPEHRPLFHKLRRHNSDSVRRHRFLPRTHDYKRRRAL